MKRSNSNLKRRRAERSGRFAEAIARLYLRLKLYAIVEKRYKTPGGEIDIIAIKGSAVVFVEVKMRRSTADEYDALASVNQRRIIRAAQFFLAQNPELAQKHLRFDVIFLAPGAWPHHLQGAFEVETN